MEYLTKLPMILSGILLTFWESASPTAAFKMGITIISSIPYCSRSPIVGSSPEQSLRGASRNLHRYNDSVEVADDRSLTARRPSREWLGGKHTRWQPQFNNPPMGTLYYTSLRQPNPICSQKYVEENVKRLSRTLLKISTFDNIVGREPIINIIICVNKIKLIN